jgi:predicted transcriptional regulator
MLSQKFMECALADFIAYRNAQKMKQFKTFVESLRMGCSDTDRESINALVEGTNVLLEYKLKLNDSFMRGIQHIYNKALSSEKNQFLHGLASVLRSIDESAKFKSKVNDDGIVIDSENTFNTKASAFKQVIGNAKEKHESGELDESTYQELITNAKYVFIGSVAPYMMNTVNRLSQTADEHGATTIFHGYLEMMSNEIDRVVAGESDQIYFRTSTNRELTAIASTVVDLSHIKYNSKTGKPVRIWDWSKKAGSSDLNKGGFRSGAVNAQAIRYRNVYYTRAGGEIPKELLNVPPSDDSVEQYWKEIKLYSKETASDGVAYTDDDGTSKSKMDVALERQAMDNIDVNAYMNPLANVGPDAKAKIDDIDFSAKANDALNGIYSDQIDELQAIIDSDKSKPRDVEAAKSKQAKLIKLREGFITKLNARKTYTADAERKQANLARVNNKSFAELKKQLAALTSRNADISNEMKSLDATSDEYEELLSEMEDNEQRINDINDRLGDENAPTPETETAAVKRVMGNAQTLDNNIDDIRDGLYAELLKQGHNISPELYKKYSGQSGSVYTNDEKAILAKLADQFEKPAKQIIDLAREMNVKPLDQTSRKKFVTYLVDTFDD